MAKKPGDPTGQDPEDQDEEDPASETGEDTEESESDDEGDGGTTAKGSDLDGMTPEQLKAEAKKLRDENARRRTENRTLKDREKAAAKDAERQKTDAERLVTLEQQSKEKDRRIASLLVGSELRDYVAEKHPDYLKLSKKIVRFVDLDDLDLDDIDSVREKVQEAVEDFVKDVPISTNGAPPVDSNGAPVGGVGRGPSRGGSPDQLSAQRRAELFPGIYKSPRQG